MLSVSHVTKKYGKVTACDDVSFRLEPGNVTVLLGPERGGEKHDHEGYHRISAL